MHLCLILNYRQPLRYKCDIANAKREVLLYNNEFTPSNLYEVYNFCCVLFYINQFITDT